MTSVPRLAHALRRFVASTARRARPTRPLDIELARIAASVGGRVGVAALHIESGQAVSLNGGARFPLASVVKLPVAVQLLTRVDRGELALDTMVAVEPQHVRPGTGVLARRFQIPGVTLSVRNLLELALVVSDNTAADIVLDLAGGAGAVRERLQQLGLADISVDRSILQLLADIEGVDALPVSGGVTPAAWRTLTLAVAPTRRDAAERAFLNEPRDTATPDAMVRLLARIADGSAVGPAMRSSLLDILSRCDTGHDRICGWMPAGTRVAHKTGTIEGPPGRGRRYPRVVNDVGLVAMPDGRGCMALAVFVTGSAETADAQARAIARIARTVHDSFGANMRP